MSIKYSDFGEKIKKMRVLKNFTQEELGNALGIHPQSVSRIEKGERTVSVDEFEVIADFFEVPSRLLAMDGWIEEHYGLPYEIKNRRGIQLPQFVENFLESLDMYFENSLDSINGFNPNTVKEIIENTKEVLDDMLKGYKSK